MAPAKQFKQALVCYVWHCEVKKGRHVQELVSRVVEHAEGWAHLRLAACQPGTLIEPSLSVTYL